MNKKKLKVIEKKGFKTTSVKEFLELTAEEETLIELKLSLSNALKQERLRVKLSQEEFAKKLKTSQSRLAKMEAGDNSVTFDLLIKNLIKSGVNRSRLSEIIES